MFIYNSLKIQVKASWIHNLLEEYRDFLVSYHTSQKLVLFHLRSAAIIFLAMEEIFPSELNNEWLEKAFEINISKNSKSRKSLEGFLVRKGFIQQPSQDHKYRKICDSYILNLPEGFKKCIRLFYEDKLELQKRQLSNNASSPIKSSTIESTICFLARMIKWITQNHEDVSHWTDFNEAIINQYLLSLPPSSREWARKVLYQFFKYAKRKRFLFTIPMVDYKTRSMPRVTEPLTIKEQRKLYRRIVMEGVSYPYEALLTSLAFFHAVQSRYIRSIKLNEIDIKRGIIYMENIPNLYLLPIEMILLKEYLTQRKTFPNHETNSHLFVKRERGDYFPDNEINKIFLKNLVKRFSGFTPKVLRITCFQEMATLNGPNFLREAYGVSKTHAGRYGSYEEYLVEEALKEIDI